MIPLDTATVHSLRRFDEAAMRRRTVTREGRAYSSRALLDSVLPGHAASLAPVIGHGMTQDLEGAAPITNPHGFSVEWLRIEPGQQVGAFKLAEKQVLMVFAGAIDVALEGAAPVRAHSQDVFSVPADCWRTVAAAGDEAAEIAIITAGDHKKHPVWSAEVVAAAREAGYALDHSGYIARLDLLPHDVQVRAA